MSLNQSWRENHNNKPKDANSLRRKPQWHVFTGSTEDKENHLNVCICLKDFWADVVIFCLPVSNSVRLRFSIFLRQKPF